MAACNTGQPRENQVSQLQKIQLPHESADFTISIYEINDTASDLITIKGYVTGYEDPPLVVLKGENNNFIFNSFEAEEKPEGHFTANIPRNELTTGRYRLGLAYIEDSRKSLRFTDNYIYNFFPETGSATSETSDIIYNIEFIRDSLNKIFIDGWAYAKNTSSDKARISIYLIGPEQSLVYPVQMVNRKDVTAWFASKENIDNSGFSTVVEKKSLTSTSYRIGILIDNGRKRSYALTDKKAYIVKRKNFTVPSKPTENIKANIDIIKNSGNKIFLSGWAFLKGAEPEKTVTWVVFHSWDKTYIFNAQAAPRPDVTNAFKESGMNLDSSGFELSIDKSMLDKSGTYSLGLFLENKPRLIQGYADAYKTVTVE